ncbi:DUF2306 domain-containing protein [Roseivivax sediminis]|uniref:Uncharacterized membrane protein n=1 Tax=Roseivivax sediminis TaxID=936889 RepID=A0A1I1ZPS0_9RHOB|nr:DUF2306 domain-containing protein [Roseivivax sediminis]SFE33632.1 Uncharacterized membrane protein [Roseivivax sediminis]
MTWAPLWQAGPVIASHAVAALVAVGLGAVQFALPKGTRTHRVIGTLWVAGMAFVALGSFAIHTFQMVGPFSPIHLLSVLVLVQLWRALAHARAERIDAHRQAMAWLYALALILTGAFTLLPGRVMHAVIFGA